MTTLNDILFPVRKVDFTETFGMNSNSDYAHAIVGTFDGVDRVLNVCSDRYELVTNEQIFVPIREMLLDSGYKFEEHYTMTENNACFDVRYRITDNALTVGQGNDIVYPEMRVSHSYNGLRKYAISFGYYRLICSNGLVIPVAEKKEFNFDYVGKHTANMVTQIENLKEKIEFFLCNSKLAIQGYSNLYDNWVANPQERLKEVMNAVGIANIGDGVKNPKPGHTTTADSIMTIIHNEARELGGSYIDELGQLKVNDWLIYNGLNAYFHNDENNKKSPEVRFKMDEKILKELAV